ncbi:MFS transporter [Rhodoplanes elegans]|uniref:MFS transporter n=2 Tax=Rhodoplanes elegans TaxID=29408 RepID=A0A327KHZ5_9BRAD|nr:MFS transporter [Rhodoplanes elegans]MBK5956799.1 MFS transporter [Rhodoplanes elegans]RAI37751.1 MFS transporter [Rhodoplanes elegans]
MLHDGYTDVIYVLLPVWQAEFGLGYAAVGLLRGLYAGTMAGLQVPAGLLAERLGAVPVLALGTALAGLGYVLAGASTGLVLLAVALAASGLGSATQHPLASALVARTFEGPRVLKAIGTYNFTGDLGKMLLPLAAALLMTVASWRATVVSLGFVGIAAAVAILAAAPRTEAASGAAADVASGTARPRPGPAGFRLLVGIAVVDSAVRMAFLTFLPFLLVAKGADVGTVGFALALVFAGGAAGKLVCAVIGARIGVFATVLATEALTTVAILALLPLPLVGALVLLPVIGVALNGTSSVLYGSVPVLVAPERRARAFGLFYTATIGSGAAAPVLYGTIGDAVGLVAVLVLIAGTALLTVPLAVALRPALPNPAE